MNYLFKICKNGVSENEIDAARDFVKDYRIGHIIDFVKKKSPEQINGTIDSRYKVVYSHKVYEEYFKSKSK